MALTKFIRNTVDEKGLSIILYGDAGVGKTTFASQFPTKTLLIDLEGGARRINQTENLDVTKTLKNVERDGKVFRAFDLFNMVINDLNSEEHDYKCVVIDTLDKLEDFIISDYLYVNALKEVPRNDFGATTRALSLKLINAVNEVLKLTDKGINVVFLAHKKIINNKNPQGGDFMQISPDIKSANSLGTILASVDVVAYIHKDNMIKDNKAVGGNERILTINGNDGVVAKHRLDIPEDVYELPCDWSKIIKTKESAKSKTEVKSKLNNINETKE